MKLTRRAGVELALVAGLTGCAAIAPTASGAAAPASTYHYSVRVKNGELESGRTVKAVATVKNVDSGVKDWWSPSTVTTVVRKGVDGGYQEPYASEGYRCTPSVRAQVTSFDCKLQGADVPTTVSLRFAVRYRAR